MTVHAPEKALESLGQYVLDQRIAEGGMGTVYKAHDSATGKPVALKVLLPAIAGNAVLLTRFRQEFKAASTLNHPHIVRALEIGYAEDRYFMVMEYVDGISLGEAIERRGRLPEAEAVGLIIQVAEALAYAHGQGFLHRDVKPDNILITAQGDAKLCDLGLAKDLDAGLGLTRAGKGLGTPYFMAPEQLANAKQVDNRADIYGLAATLYIAVTGELPFASRGYLSVFKKKAVADIKSPRTLVPLLSQRLDRTVLRALSAEPADRPTSCAEFVAELTGKGADSRAAVSHKTRPLPKLPGTDRRATLRFASQSEGVCLPVGCGSDMRWAARIQDISAGGIGLLVNRRFEPGTILSVEFSGSEPNRPERLLVRVVRVQALARRKWVLGCKFSRGLGDAEVEALRQ